MSLLSRIRLSAKNRWEDLAKRRLRKFMAKDIVVLLLAYRRFGALVCERRGSVRTKDLEELTRLNRTCDQTIAKARIYKQIPRKEEE